MTGPAPPPGGCTDGPNTTTPEMSCSGRLSAQPVPFPPEAPLRAAHPLSYAALRHRVCSRPCCAICNTNTWLGDPRLQGSGLPEEVARSLR